jgi:hypothetical protein
MTCLAFKTGKLLDNYIWNRRLFMSARNFGMLSYTIRNVAKALADSLHRQKIETYWNTALQEITI